MRNYHDVVFNGKGIVSCCAALVVSGVLFIPVKDMAQNITMNDGGSSATLNLGGGTGNVGMNSWSVGGLNQLNQQWFWYSINGVVPQTIDNISAASVLTANGVDGINAVQSTYANSQLEVSITYVLSGNGVGSGSADLMEYISLLNTSASQTFNLNFYQYSDFNLLGGASDTVNISGGPGAYTGALQTTGTGGTGIAELIDAPDANFAEANYANAGVSSTLYKLNNDANLMLNDNQNAGPGDVTWALQWGATLNPGDVLNITKDKGLSIQIVPEPSTVALIALGVSALGLTLRRKIA
jgi:hypothetical protein